MPLEDIQYDAFMVKRAKFVRSGNRIVAVALSKLPTREDIENAVKK